ncbi:vitellogenin [Diabrotica virgifera virgifera]|uniref:Vitellogenin-like n=1 Tax=Diabrotica virgifera virgifera TaxID=50390 RepID=A0ABM5IJV5_DIAVI|nr:vitellogenin [Diabrotica virgifera virgifera]
MWSQVVLCMLVGLAYATNTPSWTDNQEYVYQVRGRTLTGLMDVSDEYSGIFLKSKLRIQTRGDGKLQGSIENPQYTQIHTTLDDGWDAEVPEEELSWKPLPMSSKPFQIQMENGKIEKLILNRDLNNWEANMIKSIVSLFQLNTNGENTLPSPLNSLPEHGSNSGVFLTMEDTILGETETLYKIRPVPEHTLLSNEKEARFVELKQKRQQNGDLIEVIKHEDFTNNRELPAYVYGFGDYLLPNKAATNQMGTYFSRDSSSRAILAGNLNHHDVLFTSTKNTILISPSVNDEQKGAVYSYLEATMEDVKSGTQKIGEVNQAVHLENLVYSYNQPFSKDNHVEGDENQNQRNQRTSDAYRYSSGEEEYEDRDSYKRLSHRRYQRSLAKKYGPKNDNSEENLQNQPRINEAPESPLLTLTTGYKGMSIKNSVNVVKEAEKLIKKIASDLQDQEKDHHEKTLERFVNLETLMRLMNFDELKQVSDKVMRQSRNAQEAATSAVTRDVIAQTGTGPALLVIQEWIQEGKIEGEEASQVVIVAFSSVRLPTMEHLRTAFKLVKHQKVEDQFPLNNTALTGFTDLLRKAVIQKNVAKSEYPVNSFGRFRTEESKQFVREEVMPYLKEKLQKAVQRAETHRIHAYIRAVGNLPDPRILEIFEPFLEGKQQSSQFQRLLMVLAMGKLTETHPEDALAVFFRIYQNPAEHQAVRIAAVFHIMRSRPTPQILQVMASNTNNEDNDYVNAVVKQSIEELTELEAPEFAYIRSIAKGAQPLLTDKEFPAQFGGNYIRDYVIEELNTLYKTSTQIIPSKDEYVPKGFRYTMRANFNGLYQKLINMQAIVSSVDDLMAVAYQKTQSFAEQQQQQQQRAQEQLNNPWSSQNIAKLLNLKAEEREQLEAYWYLELRGTPVGMYGFDNTTMNQLPKLLSTMESAMSKGKQINLFKLINDQEMAIAVPTAMGIPFLYTYDSPMLVKVQGQVGGQVKPQLVQNQKIQTPENIQLQATIRATVSGKTQGRVTVIVPFEREQYISGYDKHWEANTPKLSIQLNVNLEKQEVKAEVELKPEGKEGKVKFLHFRSWPYTAKSDVTDLEPLSAQKSTREIVPDNMHAFKTTVGQKSVGLALEVEVKHERKFIHSELINRLFSQNGVIDGAKALWDVNILQSSEINVNLDAEQSSVRKIILRSRYDQDYQQKGESPKSEYRLNEKMSQSQRQQEIMDAVASGINSVSVNSLDTIIELKGEKTIQYLLTGAVAKSNVDPKSNVRICFKRSSQDKELKDYEAHFVSESMIPNTNALDLQYSLSKNEPKIDTKMQLVFGPSKESKKSKIVAEIKHRRSEERKQYLKELPLYEQCKQEMKESNKQLFSCTNLTMDSNLLDRIEVKLQSQNLKPELLEAIEMTYEAARFELLPSLQIKNKQQSVQPNSAEMDIKFHPDLSFVNVTVRTQNQKVSAKNIEVNDNVRIIAVAHPVFNLRDRVLSKLLGGDTFRDFCTVDRSAVNTFSNRTYDAELSNKWTVMAQYIPKLPRQSGQQQPQESAHKQLQNQLENYVVLVRQSKQSGKKELQIVLSSPRSDFETISILLEPNQGQQSKARVSVNGQKIQVNDKQSNDIKDGYIQIYELPNGEVKAEIDGVFYVIYDGERVRMTAVNGKMKNAIRGICGQFNDQDSEDFLTSETCIARKPHKFVKSFEVEGDEGKQVRKEFAGSSSQCVEMQVPLYINVITDENARRNSQDRSSKNSQYYSGKSSYRGSSRVSSRGSSRDSSEKGSEEDNDCLFHQTRYVFQGGKICFSTKPLPSCRSHCQPRDQRKKSVGVHCIQKSDVAMLWKKQVDKGNSPDFSQKKEHTTLKFEVPESCSA